jgi:hypothetical protein
VGVRCFSVESAAEVVGEEFGKGFGELDAGDVVVVDEDLLVLAAD